MTGALAASTGYSASSPSPLNGVTNQTISTSVRGSATASYSIVNDGTVRNGFGTVLEAWLTGTSDSSYDVMATLTSGSPLTGATGTWLNCGTTRTWSLTNSGNDDSTISSQLTVQIAPAGTGSAISSATITLNATSLSVGGGRGI